MDNVKAVICVSYDALLRFFPIVFEYSVMVVNFIAIYGGKL